MTELFEVHDQDDLINISSFEDLNLNANLLRGIYLYGYCSPSLIHKKLINLMLEGKNILAILRSGSGKSAGLIIGILQIIYTSIKECQAIIIV